CLDGSVTTPVANRGQGVFGTNETNDQGPAGRGRIGGAMRSVRATTLLIGIRLLAPVAALAQSSVTGVVRDSSGGVLPGVTVEAASPALIEQARTVVTDAQGLYRIVDLRPGPYTVTFTLQGFTGVKRTGIELRAEFTATVDAELQVGTVAETITVSGEAPLVDTRSDRSQTRFAIHGAPNAQPVIDRMNTEMAASNTGVFVWNGITFQEVVAETSGIGADRDTGGVQLNMIPKDGGNIFSG